MCMQCILLQIMASWRICQHTGVWYSTAYYSCFSFQNSPNHTCTHRRRGRAPFFTPPEAFIFSHLPFEPYWQLLPDPISADDFWALPEAAPAFFEAGGQLLDEGLRAVNTLPACRCVWLV